MGVPKWHYIRALQNFAHALAYNDSAKKERVGVTMSEERKC